MSDELDPVLLHLFEQRRESLPDREFLASLLQRIQRQRRAALVRQAVMIAAALLLTAWWLPDLLRATASIVQLLGAQTDAFAALPLSPFGWAASMFVGLGVILRMTPRRS